MRIVTNYKDYYDTALGYGRDESLVYVRHCEYFRRREYWKKPLPKNAEESDRYLKHKGLWYIKQDYDPRDLRNLVAKETRRFGRSTKPSERKYLGYRGNPRGIVFKVGFCGRIYSACCIGYDLDKVNKAKVDIVYDKPDFLTKYEEWEDGTEDVESFHALKVPAWVKVGSWFIKNPMLSKIAFYRVFDAYSAFQEISMFLGGVLRRSDEDMVELSDKDLRDKKGFDKWSFRKPPED